MIWQKILLAASLLGQGVGYYKIYLFHPVLLVCGIIKFKSLKPVCFIKEHPEIILMVAFSILSLLWSDNLRAGLVDVSFLIIGLTVLLIIYSSNLKNFELEKVIVLVAWANLIISVMESFSLFRYPLSQYSEYAPYFGKLYSAPDYANSTPTGFHYNPNNNAFFVLITTPIVLNFHKSIFKILYFILASFVVFMATSKLIFIGWVLFSLIFTFYLCVKTKNYKIVVSIVASFILLFFILFKNTEGVRLHKYKTTMHSMTSFVQEASTNLISRFKGESVNIDYRHIDYSLHERLTLLDGLVSIIKDNWLIGTGAGSLKGKYVSQAGHRLSLESPHFYFFELFTKYGLIFICIYFFWLLKVFFRLSQINFYFACSMGFIIFFNPVISSQIYFLPKWALYAFFVKVIDNSHLPLES